MATPRNHHYVPQHFLRAWAKPGGDRLTRYQRVPATGKFERKVVAIRNTASKDDLYRVTLPDGSFEIESTLMSQEVDDPGYKILSRIRSVPFCNLKESERKELAIYWIGQEARHPETIADMDGPQVREHLELLRKQHKEDGRLAPTYVDEVIDYFKASPSIGVLSMAFAIKNERNGLLDTPFAKGLTDANVVELTYEEDVLLTSDFPGFRIGHYLEQFFFTVAVNPRKALVYSPKGDVALLQRLEPSIAIRLINLYTLANATRAYGEATDVHAFVEKHLGWARKVSGPEGPKAYVLQFLREELGG